jgi:hypothetical protein
MWGYIFEDYLFLTGLFNDALNLQGSVALLMSE